MLHHTTGGANRPPPFANSSGNAAFNNDAVIGVSETPSAGGIFLTSEATIVPTPVPTRATIKVMAGTPPTPESHVYVANGDDATTASQRATHFTLVGTYPGGSWWNTDLAGNLRLIAWHTPDYVTIDNVIIEGPNVADFGTPPPFPAMGTADTMFLDFNGDPGTGISLHGSGAMITGGWDPSLSGDACTITNAANLLLDNIVVVGSVTAEMTIDLPFGAVGDIFAFQYLGDAGCLFPYGVYGPGLTGDGQSHLVTGNCGVGIEVDGGILGGTTAATLGLLGLTSAIGLGGVIRLRRRQR